MTERPPSHVNLTVDIETFGGTQKPTREDISIPGNYKNPETIEKYITAELPAAHNKQALDTAKGEIVCIGIARDDEPTEVLYRNNGEGELMQQFNDWLQDKGINEFTQVYWIGGNVEGFDLPMIRQRSWKYNLPLITGLIPHKRYDEHIVDIIRIFSAPDTQKKHSVDTIAKFFGLKGKTGLPSADVPQAYLDGRHDEISARCGEDVDIERKIAKILSPSIWG